MSERINQLEKDVASSFTKLRSWELDHSIIRFDNNTVLVAYLH